MRECEYMLNALKKQVDLLEVAFNNPQTELSSKEIWQSICSKEKALKLVQLINSVMDETKIQVNNKSSIDVQNEHDFTENIFNLLVRTNKLIQRCSTDITLFEYEIDSLTTKDSNGSIVSIDPSISPTRKGIRIISYKGKGENSIVIPKYIDGLPVVCIGSESFKDSDIREVILPSTILAIFSHAFWNCKNLEHINMSNNIRYLGEYCFSNSGIIAIRFPNSISSISIGCCFGCEHLTEVEFGENLLTIEAGAFMSCTKMKDIVLPNSITRIGSSAFSGTALTQIILPENMQVIAKDCFSHPYLKGNTNVICVVKGKETKIKLAKKDQLQGVAMIYCYPGSEIERIAHIYKIPVKSIIEFRMEDYQ